MANKTAAPLKSLINPPPVDRGGHNVSVPCARAYVKLSRKFLGEAEASSRVYRYMLRNDFSRRDLRCGGKIRRLLGGAGLLCNSRVDNIWSINCNQRPIKSQRCDGRWKIGDNRYAARLIFIGVDGGSETLL